VGCAVEVQQGMAERNADIPGDHQIACSAPHPPRADSAAPCCATPRSRARLPSWWRPGRLRRAGSYR
jgi:hypothetical protein